MSNYNIQNTSATNHPSNNSQTTPETSSSGKYPVHLTFDDGPHLTFTPKVLDILKEEKITATFFVLGEHFAGGKENCRHRIIISYKHRKKISH